MLKKLFIIFVFMMGLLFSVSCDNNNNNNNNDEPEKVTVESGIAALKETGNYQLNIDMKTIYSDNEIEDMVSFNISVKGNAQKIVFNEGNYSVSLYTVTETKDDVEDLYIIFNANDIADDLTGYVKVSLNELKELFFDNPDVDIKPGAGLNTEEVTPGDEVSEEEKIFKALTDLGNFFMNLKDEYFDLVDVEDYYYVFNETGKSSFKAVMDEFVKVASNGETNADVMEIDIEVTAQVDDKYLTNLLVDLIGKNIDDGETETIRFDAAFEKIGEVEVILPTETMTLEEFVLLVQGGGSVEIA